MEDRKERKKKKKKRYFVLFENERKDGKQYFTLSLVLALDF